MSSIVIDGLSEEDFRRSIQNRLREGKASSTIIRLRALLSPFAGPGGVLPERFLTVEAADLILTGWHALGEAAARHDRPGRPVTALSIAFGWPGEDVPEPDAQGHLPPFIETSYFNDDSFPFSLSSREDLLEGYSFDGCTWSGDPQASDTAVAVAGIDDLNGALAALEARLLATDALPEDDLRAGSLGACLLSALLIQAVTQQIERDGLPRPLCVTAGSSGVYPYFDAPVAGMSAAVLKANEAEEDTIPAGQDVPIPRYSSLLMTGIPRAKKRAVLVLEESADELELRITGLRNLNHAEPEAPEPPRDELPVAPQPELPELPELEPPASDGGLLLARKPVKHSADFRDMLSPRGTDLQQRLQSLVALPSPPVAEPAAPPAPLPLAERNHAWPDEVSWLSAGHAVALPNEPCVDALEEAPALNLRGRLRAKVTGWLDYFRW